MTAVWILLGIVLFFALLLSCSLTFYVKIGERVSLSVGICGFRYRILPGREKSEQKRRKKEEKAKRKKKKKADGDLSQKKKKLAEKKPDETTFSETLEFIRAIVGAVLPGTVKMLSHLRLIGLRLQMTVACEDADQTAIRYGQVSAGIYTLLAAIDNAIRLRVKWVDILPDFVSGEPRYDISFRVKLRLCHIVGGGIGMLFRLLVNIMKDRDDPPAANGEGRTKENRTQPAAAGEMEETT